jgi:hypothetical protein
MVIRIDINPVTIKPKAGHDHAVAEGRRDGTCLAEATAVMKESYDLGVIIQRLNKIMLAVQYASVMCV